MKILTIETTCDETAAAVVTDHLEVLSAIVASQDELHERFRGVVPEIAARAHVERILPVIDEALQRADVKPTDLSAIAVANTPGLAADVFDEIAEAGIVVDMIVQSYSSEGTADLSFTFPKEDLPRALATSSRICDRFGCRPPSGCPQIAQLSVYGIGLRSHTEVVSRMVQSLGGVGINVEMIDTSEMCVSVVVAQQQGGKGLAALKEAFKDVTV